VGKTETDFAPTRAWRTSLVAFVLLSAVRSAATSPPRPPGPIDAGLSTTERRQLEKEARTVVDALQNYHYSGGSFREIENSEMITRYLNELDPGNEFLTRDDVMFVHERFDHSLKSVYLYRGDLEPAFEIFDLFAQRTRERLAWIDEWLGRPVDLAVDESVTEPSEKDLPVDPAALDRKWGLYLKDQFLVEILAGRSIEAAKTAVGRRYSEYRRQIAAVDFLAVRERFFDAAIRSYDPHSGYFSPDSAREFSEIMGSAIVGIGLDLKKEEDACLVAGVQPDGPADLHSEIHGGDTVVGLAEGDGPWKAVGSLRVQQISAMERGKAGTKVRVAYYPAGTSRREEVALERAQVLATEYRAHGAICQVPDPTGRDRRVGWIALPTFYEAQNDPAGASATNDVRELIEKMSSSGIDALVFDIRGNPGGSLPEAVSMTGLFIPQGAAACIRTFDGAVTSLKIPEHGAAFSGPLIVLTSPQSASASELFAGALKFYRRALIAGGVSTFGKGTAQYYLDLSKILSGAPGEAANWGTLRLTSQRFYAPDGTSVQRDGVVSDVVLPGLDVAGQKREIDLPHALPVESITPPEGAPLPGALPFVIEGPLLKRLRESAAMDISGLPEWSLFLQDQKAREDLLSDKTRDLRLEIRQRNWETIRGEFESLRRKRRELAARISFATEPVEIAAVQAIYDGHDTRLRSGRTAEGQPLVGHLDHGEFVVELARDRLREVPLERIDFTEFSGDAEDLAASFSAGSGRLASAQEIGRVLQDLALLEHRTDGAVLACFCLRIASCSADTGAARRGADAFFRRAAEIDGDILRERPGYDVPLRECLRLALEEAQFPEKNP
jgi:carboxyl-terminal processing protease